MKKSVLLVEMMLIASLLTGCEPGGSVNKQMVGGLTGGALGGAIGSQIGRGTGKSIATVAGTLIGAGLGGAIGKSMDEVDRMKMNQTLETVPNNQTVQWQNPNTGGNYAVTPTNAYYQNNNLNQPCRNFTTTATIHGQLQHINGTACRNSDGNWRIVS